MEYRVRYEIDVEASNPREAALMVERILRDPDSQRPVLEVNTTRMAKTDLSWKGAESFDLSEVEIEDEQVQCPMCGHYAEETDAEKLPLFNVEVDGVDYYCMRCRYAFGKPALQI